MNTFYQVLIVYAAITFVAALVCATLEVLGRALSAELPMDDEL